MAKIFSRLDIDSSIQYEYSFTPQKQILMIGDLYNDNLFHFGSQLEFVNNFFFLYQVFFLSEFNSTPHGFKIRQKISNDCVLYFFLTFIATLQKIEVNTFQTILYIYEYFTCKATVNFHMISYTNPL